jgi:hypothetical protein
MAKVPVFAKAFIGRWRIVEMDVWNNDVLDLVEEAHLTFKCQSAWKFDPGLECAPEGGH